MEKIKKVLKSTGWILLLIVGLGVAAYMKNILLAMLLGVFCGYKLAKVNKINLWP